VAGIVRHPDPVPCPNCEVGEWDMCRNGQYTERGIKEIDGFCRERFRADPGFLVKVAPHLGMLGVLMEPASVLAKAWEHVERIGQRALWRPRRCWSPGRGRSASGGPHGPSAGLEVDVLDRIEDGPKPGLVADLGARYHVGSVQDLAAEADIVIECTGVGQLVFDILPVTPPGAITCLTGISTGVGPSRPTSPT
jgi:threonine dehydrogenase-like Zn-dependent dehydrogenase